MHIVSSKYCEDDLSRSIQDVSNVIILRYCRVLELYQTQNSTCQAFAVLAVHIVLCITSNIKEEK